jgi:hypothetical protein
MVSLEWDPNYVPPVKLGLHIAQIVASFVLWCIAIAVFRGEDAKIVGNNGWTFGVCFLSIPAWIYLIMTPRWERTRRFAEPHAMLAVDGVFTIIWLSAFATQAAYNSSGDCGKACKLSGVVVGLGVIVTLLFGGTTFLSGYTLQYYKFHGTLPGYDSRQIHDGGNIDPDKAAFSMAPHDEEAYERVHMDDHDAVGPSSSTSYGGAGAYSDNQYGNANPYSADDYDDPNRYGALPPRNNAMFDSDLEYSSGANQAPPRQSSPYGGAQAYDEPAQFPAANYDRTIR